jgi:hypothetical protein
MEIADIKAGLEKIKGDAQALLDKMVDVEVIVHTPFGDYVRGEDGGLKPINPVATEPAPVERRKIPQLNLYPQEGVIYKNADAVAGPGQTKMYDYNNGEVVIVKNCGPLGS